MNLGTRSVRVTFAAILALPLPMVAASAGDGGSEQPTCDGRTATINDHTGEIRGTAGPNVIIGDNGPNVIYGFEMKDRICSLGGRDLVFGGDGSDVIFGGAGADGSPPKNTVSSQPTGGGQEPTEYGLFGDSGEDVISGGNGTDFLDGGRRGDTLSGNDGDDEIFGGNGPDTAFGGIGDDLINLIDSQEGNDAGYGGSNTEEGGDYCAADAEDTLAGCEYAETP